MMPSIQCQCRKIAARPRNFPKTIGDLRENWDEPCEHVSDNSIQASVKRAHSYDAYHQLNLGVVPYDKRLDKWGDVSDHDRPAVAAE